MLLPAVVQFVETGVTLDAVLGHRADEVLAGFCVFLCLDPTTFRGVSTVFLRFFWLGLSARMRAEDGRGAQNFVEVLKLLASPLLVCICDSLFINLDYIGEAVHNEGSE